MIKCVVCSQEVTSRRGLAFHLKKHNIESVDEYLKLYPDQIQYVEPKDENLITCPICGRYNLKQLGQHIVGTHKMTHEEFSKLYPDQKMFIDEISERCRRATFIGRDQYYKNKEADPEGYQKRIEARVNKRKEHNPDLGKKISSILRDNGAYDRMSDWAKKKWQEPEYRKMQSDKAKKQHENGLTDIITRKSGKKRYKVIINNIEYSMRSTWEVEFAKILNEKGIDFKYECFTIDYEYGGKIKKYYPDFIITNTNIIFEVKPKTLIPYAVNIAKQNASIAAGYDFRYITEDELKNIDSINFLGCF